MVDGYCYQVLAATVDTEERRARVRSDGTIRFPLRYKPVIQVSKIEVGYRPSQMGELPSLDDVAIGLNGVIEIPYVGGFGAYGFNTSWGTSGTPLVRVTYLNGYANTVLGATVTPGATSVTLGSVLGVFPGTVLQLSDPTVGTELLTVGSAYVVGATAVPLVSPLRYAHAAGVSVSNLPPRVKQATILLAASLIRTRGSDAIVLQLLDSSQTAPGLPQPVTRDIQLAQDLLSTFRRVR
jgi:hypothetical protein